MFVFKSAGDNIGCVPGKSLVLDRLPGGKVFFLNKKSESAPFTYISVYWTKANRKVNQHFLYDVYLFLQFLTLCL